MLFNSKFMPCCPTMQPEAIISLVPAPTKQYWEQATGNKNTDINESNQNIANALGTMMAGFGAQAGVFPGVPHILAGHFSVSGAMVSDTQTMIGRDIELSQEQIGFANADLTCLGHIHLPQKIGENIFYSGSISSLNFGELHDHGCFLHTIGKDHTKGKDNNLVSYFLKTPATKLIKLRADLTNGCRNPMDVLQEQDPMDMDGARVWLEIRVFQDEAASLQLSDLTAFHQDLNITVQRVPRETVRSSKILSVERLRDKLTAMAELRMEEVPDSILAKADDLESMGPDELLQMVSNG